MVHRRAVNHLSAVDPKLFGLIREIGACGFKADKSRTVFEALVRSVTFQQLHGNAARAILGRVLALYPRKKFPTPKEILKTDLRKLRKCGLSRAKILAIKDIARAALDGTIPSAQEISSMDDEMIIERLISIRGVGRWTVEMLLMFTLGRLDVLPVHDYGVRNGFGLTYKRGVLPKPKELQKFGERWRPYRSIAAWYMWRAVDQARAKAKSR